MKHIYNSFQNLIPQSKLNNISIFFCTKFDPLASIRETMFSLPEYCSATISHFHIFNATSKAIATLAIANPQIEKLLYSDLDVLEKMSKLKEKWP